VGSGPESPIFTRTFDFLVWLLEHTSRFPKSERFRMARMLEEAAVGLYDELLASACARRKEPALRRADLALARLRVYLRLSVARGLTSERQYEHASRRLAEIGRLLGGWMRSVGGESDGPGGVPRTDPR